MANIIAPAHDNKIYQKYNKKTLTNKEKNKIRFCQDFGLRYDKKSPLLALTFPLSEENNIEMLKDVMAGILEEDILMVLTGIGTKRNQEFFTDLADKYSEKMVILDENEENKRKIYASSDIFINTCNTKECLVEMENAMNYGVVPISTQNEFIADYNGAKETGNAFIYKENNPWSFFAAMIRAFENYKFPYDWKTIQKNAMGEDLMDEE